MHIALNFALAIHFNNIL